MSILFGTANWFGIISMIFLIITFYFVLTFFQHLKSNDTRLIKQTKIAAVISLTVALLVPAFLNFYLYMQMMR